MINDSSPEDPGGTFTINRLKAIHGTAEDVRTNFISIFGEDGCNFSPVDGNPVIRAQLKQISSFLKQLPLIFEETEAALLASANPPPLTGNHPNIDQLEIRLEKKITSLFEAMNDQLSSNLPRSPFQRIPPTPGVSMNTLHQTNGLWTQPPPRGANFSQRFTPTQHSRSGQSAPRRPQPNSIAIFPGPKDNLDKTAFSQDQLDSIHKTAIGKGYRVSYAGHQSNKIPLLHHPAMSIVAMLREIKELYPQYSPEVSTKKWIKIFIHKLDFHDSLEILQLTDRKAQAHLFVKSLLNKNTLNADICTPENIKILSSSQSKSTGNAGVPYLRLAALIHPDFLEALSKITPTLGSREFYINTDSILPKCFVCSKLGHNDPRCSNSPSCPFCGEDGHPLQKCTHYNQDLDLNTNKMGYANLPETNGELHCALCKSNKHPSGYNHCGLDRNNCHTYKDARTRKFAVFDDKIPPYTDNHFSHFFKAANQLPSDPQTSAPLNENMTSHVVGVIRTSDEIQPEAPQAATRRRISINGN